MKALKLVVGLLDNNNMMPRVLLGSFGRELQYNSSSSKSKD